ncbi:MAG: GNAT family N-acetyltransferase [Ahrensia sp.]|nr:GNAT family N-acetyltransferase [Ahrensia sp.]
MTDYEREWQRQLARTDIPRGHLPVYRWYLQLDDPASVAPPVAPRSGITITHAKKPTIAFYRFLYHTAGEDYLWGDRRRRSDEDLMQLISPDHILIMVMYCDGVPAGFYELDTISNDESEIRYFALLPGFLGGGLGRYLLDSAIVHAGKRNVPLVLDTCTLDHPIALENYKARGFRIVGGEDETYPDPRADGTVPRDAGKHVPLCVADLSD